MKHNRKILSILVALTSSALVSSLRAAPPPPPLGAAPPPPMMRPLPLPELFKAHARLTPAQGDAVRKIMAENRGKIDMRRNEMQSLDRKINETVLAARKVDQDALNALVKQKAALQRQAEEQRVGELVAIRALMTPMQCDRARKAYKTISDLSEKLNHAKVPTAPMP